MELNVQSNPWVNLSQQSPYIAEVDREYFEKYSDQLSHLELSVLPDPYVGDLKKAKVVFLLLNPGFQEGDNEICAPHSEYFHENKASLTHAAHPPFYVLGEKFKQSGGYAWWIKKLKRVMESGVSISNLSEEIMCIQFFPYHSEKYKHFPKKLPSQYYSFELVKEAIRKQKTIVMMRSEKRWLEAVPELKGNYIKIRNVRNPTVSDSNMKPEEFQRIINELKE